MKKANDYNVEKICKCGRHYFGIGALSRRDNKTEICSQCGLEEALVDFFKNCGTPALQKKYENKTTLKN